MNGLVICCFILSLCVLGYRSESDKSGKQICTQLAFDRHLRVGETVNLSGKQCSRVSCHTDRTLTTLTCGKSRAENSECRRYEPDISQPFPACCELRCVEYRNGQRNDMSVRDSEYTRSEEIKNNRFKREATNFRQREIYRQQQINRMQNNRQQFDRHSSGGDHSETHTSETRTVDNNRGQSETTRTETRTNTDNNNRRNGGSGYSETRTTETRSSNNHDHGGFHNRGNNQETVYQTETRSSSNNNRHKRDAFTLASMMAFGPTKYSSFKVPN